jgi:hypothetical protein
LVDALARAISVLGNATALVALMLRMHESGSWTVVALVRHMSAKVARANSVQQGANTLALHAGPAVGASLDSTDRILRAIPMASLGMTAVAAVAALPGVFGLFVVAGFDAYRASRRPLWSFCVRQSTSWARCGRR